MPSIAIVGASSDRSKFGNKAVRAYVRRGWEVHPINPKDAEIEGLPVRRTLAEIGKPVDRVTLYLPPVRGIALLEEIAAAKPGELFLNPGTESPELLAKAQELGLKTVSGCAIVAIGESPMVY